MRLKYIEIAGFKSFAKKAMLSFDTPVTAVVGPNGSGKSNVVESFRFVLGEQSMKSMRGKSGSDLIFRGGAGSNKLSRASVTIAFDNSDKVFAFQEGSQHEIKIPALFDTVTFTREIYADGASKYLLNGTEVRLKTVVELLASVNIGTSSHHIISQGEADGILRASPRDRREMLEDALGLKIYHYRIKEAENKLGKTATTLKEVQSLRRELAPHLKFLAKQVEKIEKSRALREELRAALLQFLATERAALAREDDSLRQSNDFATRSRDELTARLAALPEAALGDETRGEREALEAKLREIIEQRRAIESRISRLEGMLEAHRALTVARGAPIEGAAVEFAPTEYHQFVRDLDYFVDSFKRAETLQDARATLALLEPLIARLKLREPKEIQQSSSHGADTTIAETTNELEGFARDLTALLSQQEEIERSLAALRSARERSIETHADATRERYEVKAALTNAEAELQILAVSKNAFLVRKEAFDTELKEAGFMFGPAFLHALHDSAPIPELDLHEQHRAIDRLKIRLDEHSGIDSDVTTEYESAKERDEFLARELVDVEASVRNLEGLIIDLKRVLDERFTKGVTVINERFGEFFKTMFGGGGAFLSVTMEKKRKRKSLDETFDEDVPEDENDESLFERGIDIHVNLPSKKVKELNMLSGGERSLVSIALLFAISQVNPPPFLVLDETDAALDEANSRKYGDMVERLSEYSQLIVVTHNRETMSRANVLYGVTLGADGGSKLLSIKFDEAVKVAK